MYERIRIGDKVKCILPFEQMRGEIFTKDKSYRIVGLRYRRDLTGYGSYKIIDDNGDDQWFDSARLITGSSKWMELIGRRVLLERKVKGIREIRNRR